MWYEVEKRVPAQKSCSAKTGIGIDAILGASIRVELALMRVPDIWRKHVLVGRGEHP